MVEDRNTRISPAVVLLLVIAVLAAPVQRSLAASPPPNRLSPDIKKALEAISNNYDALQSGAEFCADKANESSNHAARNDFDLLALSFWSTGRLYAALAAATPETHYGEGNQPYPRDNLTIAPFKTRVVTLAAKPAGALTGFVRTRKTQVSNGAAFLRALEAVKGPEKADRWHDVKVEAGRFALDVAKELAGDKLIDKLLEHSPFPCAGTSGERKTFRERLREWLNGKPPNRIFASFERAGISTRYEGSFMFSTQFGANRYASLLGMPLHQQIASQPILSQLQLLHTDLLQFSG